MSKKVKLIIGIVIFVCILGVIGSFYYVNMSNEEVLEDAVSVGVVKITDENFEKEVLKSDKPVILDFSSNSCPPCVAMMTTLIDIAKNNKDIKVATLNVDSKKCEDIIKEYPVNATPTIMIFKNGEVTSTLVGAVNEEKIMSAINYKKYLILLFLVFMMTGCGNSQKLTCTFDDESEDIKKYSKIEVKVKDDRVADMKFTVDMIFPDEYRSQLADIASSVRSSKPYMKVSLINGGIRLVTDNDKDSFIGIKMNQKITYGELKGMLELQDYVCE